MSVSGTTVRLAVASFSPFAKRLFWWNPALYTALSLAPLLAAVRTHFNWRRGIGAAIVVCWLLAFGRRELLLVIGPALFIWVLMPRFPEHEILAAFWNLRFIFMASVGYGLAQRALGYLPFEIAWLESGLGMIGQEGFFLREELRAFSFFSGVAEFGFFSAVMLFLATARKSIVFVIVSLVATYLSGSRGMIVSIAVAGGIILAARTQGDAAKDVLRGFALAVLCYVFLGFAVPVIGWFQGYEESRLLVYGTFQARVLLLLEFLSNVDAENLFVGGVTDRLVLDNFYLFLVDKLGVWAAIGFVAIVARAARTPVGVYAGIILLSYSLYADVLSVYLLYPLLALLYSKPLEAKADWTDSPESGGVHAGHAAQASSV